MNFTLKTYVCNAGSKQNGLFQNRNERELLKIRTRAILQL